MSTKEQILTAPPQSSDQKNLDSPFTSSIVAAVRGEDQPEKETDEKGPEGPVGEPSDGGLLRRPDDGTKDEPPSGQPAEPEAEAEPGREPEPELEDIQLPPTASRNAREAFDGIKSQRNEAREQLASLKDEIEKLKQEADEDPDLTPDLVKQSPEYVELQKKLEEDEIKLKTFEEQVEKLSEKSRILDLQNDPEFVDRFDKRIATAEEELVGLLSFGADSAELIGMAKTALSQPDDQSFYRMAGEMAETLPAYAQANSLSILRDIRKTIVERQRALNDHESTIKEYAAVTEKKKEAMASKYVSERVPQIERLLDEGEKELIRHKSSDAIQEVIKPIKEQSRDIYDRTLGAIQGSFAKFGGVSDELAAMAIQGARRIEDVAMSKAISEAYANLRKEHDRLKSEYQKITGGETVERKSGEGGATGESGAAKAEKPGSFADFFAKQARS